MSVQDAHIWFLVLLLLKPSWKYAYISTASESTVLIILACSTGPERQKHFGT